MLGETRTWLTWSKVAPVASTVLARTATREHPMTATATDTKLTRAEAAYAHLASFKRGDTVDVEAAPSSSPAPSPSRSSTTTPTSTARYLIVTGCGTETRVSVATLLSGRHTITSLADAKAGRTRYFDAATWATQNPEGRTVKRTGHQGRRSPHAIKVQLRSAQPDRLPRRRGGPPLSARALRQAGHPQAGRGQAHQGQARWRLERDDQGLRGHNGTLGRQAGRAGHPRRDQPGGGTRARFVA